MEVPGDSIEPSLPMPVRQVFAAAIEDEHAREADPGHGVSSLSVGAATLVKTPASAYRFWRAGQDIAGCSDALCIYQRLDGDNCLDSEFVVEVGSLATGYSDLPFAKPGPESGLHLRVIKIPMTRCKTFIGRGQDLVARPLRIEPGPGALFANFFEAFVEQAPHLNGAAAEAAVQTLAQLAIAARGAADQDDSPGRNRARAGLLQRAMQTIESNIHQPNLSPSVMAGILCISVRRLHLLFQPTGTTYARYVLSRRLERARLLLVQPSKRPVTDVAFACGFEGISTFYRSFRAAFGMSPTDFRKSVE